MISKAVYPKQFRILMAALGPAVLAATLLTLSACASLPLSKVDAQLRQSLPASLAAQASWRRGPQADAAAQVQVKQLVGDGVSQDAAVQIALLANPDLQIALEQLGVARAQWLEAAQIANPIASWSSRALRGGPGSNVEYSIAQNLLDIFTQPGRKRAANAGWQAAQLEAVAAVLHLALTVRQQYLRTVAAAYLDEQARQRAAIGQLMFELAERFHAAGNLSLMEREQQRDKAVAVRGDAARASANAVEQRERLLRLLGVVGQYDEIKLIDALPELPNSDPDLRLSEQRALQTRVDLLAARKQVEARLQQIGSARRWRWLRGLELRGSSERDPAGARVVGPGVSLELPLFTVQQAALASSDVQARLSMRRAEAVALDVRMQLRSAHAQLTATRDISKAWQDEALPAREAIVESAQREYFYMLKGPWDPLLAQQELLAARSGAAAAVRDYWLARIEFAAAAGDLALAAPSTASVSATSNLEKQP